ncbi:undecaprenyl-diphosphate phosphatase [Egbenema bharatensis]|uniref:undecaprenyl-diphosphate phosphatase n=1 Tax=Egbenema bharatensis TaxID=3463334 RepID=UPI003A864EA9
MSLFESVLLGIIQGIFMFFPVSSTSHLVLTQHWLIQRGSSLPSPDSPEMIFFDLVVHVGTLISIVVVFRRSLSRLLTRIWKDFWQLAPEIGSSRGERLKLRLSALRTRSLLFPNGQRVGDRLYLRLAVLGMISVLVTGLIGLPLKSVFKEVFANPLAISFTLTITGILLWCTDRKLRQSRGLRSLSPWVASVIGIGQGLALIPGLSRSGMTISFALFTGLKRQWAAEYSFFIAFPTILGATVLQTIEVLEAESFNGLGVMPLLVGFIVSAGVGIVALQMVLHLLYKARFRYFSYYVWVLAAIVALGSWQGAF